MPRKNILYICAAAGAFIAITSYAAFVETSVKNRPVVQVETKTLKDEAPSFLPAGKKWKLVWHDEFNGKEIDKTKWMCRESFWGQDFPAFAHNFEGVEMTGKTVRLHLLRKGDDFCSPHLQTGSLTSTFPKTQRASGPSENTANRYLCTNTDIMKSAADSRKIPAGTRHFGSKPRV